MIYADRVKFVTSSTGTGAVQEGSAVAPFRQLADVTGSGGRQFVYIIQNAGSPPTEWEFGIGTYTAGTPGSLSRATVFGSSNAGALVNFSAGTKTVSIPDAAAFHGVLDGEMHGAVTGGTATALTANFYPQPFALRDFARVAIKLHTNIGAAATFNPNGLGAEPIMEQAASGLQAVTAGRFKSGMILVLRRIDSQWQIANGMVQDVVPSASDTVEGIVERATIAEVLAGTDTTRYVTPDALAAAIGKKGADLTDGATVTLPNTGGDYFVLLGSTTLTAVALQDGNSSRPAGFEVTFRFAAAKNVTHSASLNLKDDADFSAASGDILVLRYEGSGVWREIDRHLELTPPDPPDPVDVEVDNTTATVTLNAAYQDTGLEVTVNVPSATAQVVLIATIGWQGHGDEMRLQFQRDGVDFGPDFGISLLDNSGTDYRGVNTLMRYNTPGAPGTYVYKLRAKKVGGGNIQLVGQTGPSNDEAQIVALIVEPLA
ncbi:MAG: hypothetical protein AB7R90_21035 [Reyranellaceae bacterium]